MGKRQGFSDLDVLAKSPFQFKQTKLEDLCFGVCVCDFFDQSRSA